MVRDEESVFQAAFDLPDPGERAAFLDRACGGDPALRQSVEALLAAYPAGGFLEEPAVAPDPAATVAYAPPAETPGGRVGPYKLLEPLGEGGMGVVYAAEQQHPVRRKVALKLVKPGMDSKQVLARFEQERQALALMDHPHIATILDAGATAAGRPYFVMELVRGVPITDYCDAHRLAVPDRLGLFAQVCRAVQHAHQKGVIHRDLKPSNVLVAHDDAAPVPKVIDFGVAKAVHQPLTEATLHTGPGQLVGTPLYMSPEQAGSACHDVDTRTDVWALGALLYELLTGTTPFDRDRLRAGGPDEARRAVREEEPPAPSARVGTLDAEARSTVSGRRGVDDWRLARQLRGELDWVVMKCLEKDRDRRYESAAALAADVERFLAGEPVLARPVGPWGRAGRWARRRPAAAALAALAAASLTGGLAGVLWHAHVLGLALGESDRLRREAVGREGELRGQLYAADLRAAREAWGNTDLLRVRSILDRYRPAGGEDDLREFGWYWLDAGRRAERAVLRGPGADLLRADASPDGRLVAAGDRAGAVTVWDLAARAAVRTLPAHRGEATALAFAPDGRTLATGGQDRAVRLWDTTSWGERACLRVDATVTALAFDPGGGRLAATGRDGRVTVWNMPDGRPHRSWRGHATVAQILTFSPDGRTLVTGGKDRTARVWDADTGRERVALVGHRSDVLAVAVGPDGRTAATGGYDGSLRTWDLGTGAPLHTVHCGQVWDLAYSPGGEYLASGGTDGGVHLWRAGDRPGELVVAKSVIRAGTARAVAFLDGGAALLAAYEEDREVRVWDLGALHGARPVRVHDGLVNAVAVSPDGQSVASADGRGEGLLWEAGTGRERHRLGGHPAGCRAAAFAPAGGPLATAGVGGEVVLRDATTGAVVRTLGRLPQEPYDLAFSPDGTLLAAVGGSSRAAVVWDVATGAVRGEPEFDAGDGCMAPAFAPDGRALAVGGRNGSVALWAVGGGGPPAVLHRHTAGISCVAFTPDGSALASADTGGRVRVWDLPAGRERWSATGHRGQVSGLAVAPDGRTMATAGLTGAVKLWHLPTGRELFDLPCGAGSLGRLAFAPDGQALFVGGVRAVWRFDAPR